MDPSLAEDSRSIDSGIRNHDFIIEVGEVEEDLKSFDVQVFCDRARVKAESEIPGFPRGVRPLPGVGEVQPAIFVVQ